MPKVEVARFGNYQYMKALEHIEFAKKASSGEDDVPPGSMVGHGWASVETKDLEGDIVEASAFAATFAETQAKGRYWFNHDKERPLGRVVSQRLVTTGDKKGVYLDKIVLPPTDFNTGYIFPLLQVDGINEHSISFFSYEPRYDSKRDLLVHHNCFLIETSAVTFAANPSAVIEGFKSLVPSEAYFDAGIGELMQLAKSGVLKYPQHVYKRFFISGFRDDVSRDDNNQTAAPVTTAKGTTMTLVHFDPSTMQPTTKAVVRVKMPSPKSSDYVDVAQKCHLVFHEDTGGFSLPVAVPVVDAGGAKGYAFDAELVKQSCAYALGAKEASGVPSLYAPVKDDLIEAFKSIYKMLGLKFPTGPDGEDVTPATAYKDVQWQNGEAETLRVKALFDAANALKAAAGYAGKSTDPAIAAYAKMYGWVDVFLSVGIGDNAAMAFLSELMGEVSTFVSGPSEKTLAAFADALKSAKAGDADESSAVGGDPGDEQPEPAAEQPIESDVEDKDLEVVPLDIPPHDLEVVSL